MAASRNRCGRQHYSVELADKICERLSNGESLNAICRDAGMPAESTVRIWAENDRDGFFSKYARARELGYQAMAEQIIAISDDESRDEMPSGTAHVQRAKLRVDARKWLLSKMLPKTFGEKVSQEISGPDGGPIQARATVSGAALSNLSAEQLAALESAAKLLGTDKNGSGDQS